MKLMRKVHDLNPSTRHQTDTAYHLGQLSLDSFGAGAASELRESLVEPPTLLQ